MAKTCVFYRLLVTGRAVPVKVKTAINILW